MATQTANMNLTKWDSVSDYFSHSQLAANWQLVDDHDHSAGKGKLIPFGGLAASSVGSSELRANAVLTANIADAQVTTAKLGAGAFTADKLADATKLGLTDSGTTRRGAVINAAAESPNAVALAGATPSAGQMASLPTVDRVTLTIPASGWVAMVYQARWQNTSSVASFSNALWWEMQIDGNRIQSPSANSAGSPYIPLTTVNLQTLAVIGQIRTGAVSTGGVGFAGIASSSNGALSGSDPTTGTILGNANSGHPTMLVYLSAGSHAIESKWVRDSSNASAAVVQERRLFVWTVGF